MSDMAMLLLSVILSSPIIFILFYIREKLLKKKANECGLDGRRLKEIENSRKINKKSILNWSILSGMLYGLLGMFIYDSTHKYPNSSSSGMFFSIFIPFIVGIFINYCITTYYLAVKQINRCSNKNQR